MSESRRCPILGVGLSPVDMTRAVTRVEEWVRDAGQDYVCVTGVHGVMECQRDAELRAIHNRAGMVVPDGMPLVWVARHRGFADTDRVYGPDLMLEVLDRGRRTEMKHFFYGGADGVAERLAERLKARFPGLRVVGCHTPPFRPLTDSEAIELVCTINEARPDVVWVGLSTPKQERWMARFRSALHAPVLIGVGAAFDFHAGLKPQAPAWMQRNGLEWLFRALSEPRRLGPRYLKNNPAFLRRIAGEELHRWREKPPESDRAAGRAVRDGSSGS